MSKPIYEPTLPRTDAELGYGRDQLFRRPAPAPQGGSLIPGFHARKTTNLTVPTANDQRINWDEWTIDGGTTYFQAGTIVAGALTDVLLNAAGWYAIFCYGVWLADPASGFGGIRMLDDDTDIAEEPKAMGLTFPVGFSTDVAMTYQAVRCYPADFTQVQTFAFVNRFEFWVVQNSGVNRTLDSAYCNIAFLGPRDTATPSS